MERPFPALCAALSRLGRKRLGVGSPAGGRMGWSSGSLLLAAALLCGSRLPAGAQTQNPRALLQKVMAAYQNLNSYDGTASVEASLLYQGKLVRTAANRVEMKYKRPNRLLLRFVNPTDSRTIVSDGTNFYVYSSALHQYSRGPTAPNLVRMLLLLRFRANVLAQLDPLYFLAFNKLPDELTNLTFQGSSTYNNKPVFVVSGVTRAHPIPIVDKKGRPLVDKTGHKVVLKSDTQYWTWWINRQTYLLEKVEASDPSLKVAGVARQGKKLVRRAVPMTQRERHVVLSATLNPALADNVFAFTPPPGAVERESTQDIIKNGK